LGELQRFCEEGRISDSLEAARLPSTNMVTQHERIPVPSLAMTTRIDSMSRLFELTLGDVRLSREFLFFLVWRNLKARYKQTAIELIWLLIQPLNMGWFWHCVRRFGFSSRRSSVLA